MREPWENWSGSVRFTPAERRAPASEAEIVDLVDECRRRGLGLRVVGAGHSFTPLVATAGVLVSLDRHAGLVDVDRAARRATLWAGTRLRDLGAALFERGLAQINLGDIDEQSIAGAISTGTHGTGATLGSISTQLVGLRLVTADGEVIACSMEREREIFRAAQVSLGALGIISAVTLQLMPSYRLRYTWEPRPLGETLERLEEYRAANRHFEFYWIPYTGATMVKLMNPTEAPAAPDGLMPWLQAMVLENGALWVLSEICRLLPPISPAVAGLMGGLISAGEDVNHSHRIFATPRLVRFQEMEYSLPAAAMAPALRKIDALIRERRVPVHFPLECRFVRGDDIPLSPAYGRDSAYIAVHMYRGMAYRPYFDAVEAILQRHGGRPHWGKHHSMSAGELRARYPEWEAFQTIRRRLDPQGIFLNPYLRAIFAE